MRARNSASSKIVMCIKKIRGIAEEVFNASNININIHGKNEIISCSFLLSERGAMAPIKDFIV